MRSRFLLTPTRPLAYLRLNLFPGPLRLSLQSAKWDRDGDHIITLGLTWSSLVVGPVVPWASLFRASYEDKLFRLIKWTAPEIIARLKEDTDRGARLIEASRMGGRHKEYRRGRPSGYWRPQQTVAELQNCALVIFLAIRQVPEENDLMHRLFQGFWNGPFEFMRKISLR